MNLNPLKWLRDAVLVLRCREWELLGKCACEADCGAWRFRYGGRIHYCSEKMYERVRSFQASSE